jgi:hypothetical protein
VGSETRVVKNATISKSTPIQMIMAPKKNNTSSIAPRNISRPAVANKPTFVFADIKRSERRKKNVDTIAVIHPISKMAIPAVMITP